MVAMMTSAAKIKTRYSGRMLRDFGIYLREMLRAGFAMWERHEAKSVLGAAIAAAILAALSAHGIEIIFKVNIGNYFAVILVIWFTIIVFIFTPFRIWRKQNSEIYQLKEAQEPRLAIEFDPAGEDFVTWKNVTIGQGPNGRPTISTGVWIRLRPYSLTGAPVRRCVARMLDVRVLEGEPLDQSWGDSLQLAWATSGGESFSEKDIFGREVRQFVDVAYAIHGQLNMQLAINVRPYKNPGALQPGRTYRLKVGVLSQEDGQMATKELDVKWGGDFDKLEISEADGAIIWPNLPNEE
jgi:hypothetical protein